MKKTKKILRILLFVICIFIAGLISIFICGCSDSGKSTKHEICNFLKISDIPDFEVEKHIKVNADDIEEYYVVSFTNEQAEKFKSQNVVNWKKTPVESEYKNFTDYASIIPESKITYAVEELTKLNQSGNNRYYFFDGTYEFAEKYEDLMKGQKRGESAASSSGKEVWYSTDDPRSTKYAVGFSCAFFEESTNMLYVYRCEKNYSKNLMKYIK